MQMIVIIPCDIKKCSVYFFIHHVDVRKLFGGSRRVVICKTPRDLRRGLCMCASLTSTLPGSEDLTPKDLQSGFSENLGKWQKCATQLRNR